MIKGIIIKLALLVISLNSKSFEVKRSMSKPIIIEIKNDIKKRYFLKNALVYLSLNKKIDSKAKIINIIELAALETTKLGRSKINKYL